MPIMIWGGLGGHDGQRPVGRFGQDAGVKPLLFFEGHPVIFNEHRESGPRFNVSSERRRSLSSIESPSIYCGVNFRCWLEQKLLSIWKILLIPYHVSLLLFRTQFKSAFRLKSQACTC